MDAGTEKGNCTGMKRTFPGGIYPPHFKEITREAYIKKAKLPNKATIPLSQHVGTICEPTVSAGDKVKTGSLIGKSDKFISSYVHSSISGKVAKIEPRPHPILGVCNSVIIESDGEDEHSFAPEKVNTDGLTPEEIINTVREAGIAGLGGACFPTHVKLSPPKGKKLDTFILNGAECEPYLSCDHRLMLEKPQDIIKGALLIMKAIGVKKGIIAIEDNKPDAVKTMSSALAGLLPLPCHLKIASLHTKYPQGGEKQLIKVLLSREVPPNSLPIDIGCLVDNVATALAIYEAINYKKPLYERVVTVCGDAIKKQANLLVRIGTPVSDLIDECGGLTKDLGKIIFGGPMMGLSQYSKETPVVKGTSGVVFLSKKKAVAPKQAHCIRCGKCIEVCPVNLVPTIVALATEKGRLDIASDFNATDCIECGACAYACPSKVPLLHLIKQAKVNLLCEIVK